MAKRLVAKTGEYINQQQETKGEYTRIGVVLSNQNGEYMLLDPSVSLAGVLVKQNALAAKKGEQMRDNVMISIFEDENQGQHNNNNNNNGQQQHQQQQQGGWGQPQQPQQQQYNNAPQQNNQQHYQQGNQNQQPQYNNPPVDFDDDRS